MTVKTKKDKKDPAFIRVNDSLFRKDSILQVHSYRADSLINAKDRTIIGLTDGNNVVVNFESMKDANKLVDEMATLLNVEKEIRFD